MSFDTPDPPPPPDPYAVAAAQTQTNIATTNANSAANRVNTVTPQGSLTYKVTGKDANGVDIYSANQQYSPGEQGIYDNSVMGRRALGDTGISQLNQVRSATGSPLDASQFGPLASSPTNGAGGPQAIQDARDAAYNTQAQYLDPKYRDSDQQLHDKLVNQGLQPGTEAYNRASDAQGRQKTFDYTAARTAAVQAGNAEQNTLFNQGIQGANLQNSSLAQNLSQALTIRHNPLNEYDALATGSQVSNPSYASVPGSQVANTDLSGDVYKSYGAQVANYNQQVAQQNSMNAGIFGLAGAGAKAAFTL